MELPSSPFWNIATALTRRGVNPMNHALLLSDEVPVLPAIGTPSGLTAAFPLPDCTTCCIA